MFQHVTNVSTSSITILYLLIQRTLICFKIQTTKLTPIELREKYIKVKKYDLINRLQIKINYAKGPIRIFLSSSSWILMESMNVLCTCISRPGAECGY